MYDSIPLALRMLPQWVCIHGDSKVPMKAFEHEAASSTDPTTWADFAQAVAAVEQGWYENIGFVFNGNGLVGIDIDAGYEPDGLITPLAADILGKCRSYTERSRSGRGFHVILKGDLPFSGKNNLKGVEIYKASRYFIMTGDSVGFHRLEENQAAIDYVVEKYFPQTREENEDRPFGNRVYTPVWELPENGRVKLRPIYPRIPDGCRNICLTSLAGLLHNQGYNKRQIYDELMYCNTVACDPSLPQNEVQTIVNSVTRYKR